MVIHRFCLLLLACYVFWGCQEEAQGRRSAGAPPPSPAASVPQGGSEDVGAGLVNGTCGSCHLAPQPGDLPFGIWDTVVLPRMAQFMGRYTTPVERAALLEPAPAALTRQNIYPAEPMVSDQDWQDIRRYILDRAPRKMPPTTFRADTTARYFSPRFPGLFLSPPSTTFVRWLDNGSLLLADVNKEGLYLLDADLQPAATLPVGRGLTAATGFAAGDIAAVIGSFSPTDEGTGSLVRFTRTGPKTIATGLQRPTSLARLDTDNDGTPEIIVTEYGKWTGRLSLWRTEGNGQLQSETLEDRSGALAVVADTTASAPTAYVLFGQGKEEIVRYVFDKGRPRREVIRQFPPSFGSSSLQLTDWNQDGLPDLLYTNGDNADYRSPVKPYHGIRIFLGQQNGTFTEELFLPYPGAYGAKVADFNQDGLSDIAAISFFPDFSAPEPAGAVIFHQQAEGGFASNPLPVAGAYRYLTLDAADYDNDGDTDLVAGCLAMEPTPDNGRLGKWLQQGMPAVVWENEGAR